MSSVNTTRLIHLLSQSGDFDFQDIDTRFAEKFGQMLHFSSAIPLLRSLADPPVGEFRQADTSTTEIRNYFFKAQSDLVRFIGLSFTPSPRHRDDQLPTAESLYAHGEVTGVFSPNTPADPARYPTLYEPFRKFYVGRQRDLEMRTQALRVDIRNLVSGICPELARLAKIDKALCMALAESSADSFRVIPALLRERFLRLLSAHQPNFPENPVPSDIEQWMDHGGWLAAFCIEMRDILIAELEIRLQPAAGMVEAMERSIAF